MARAIYINYYSPSHSPCPPPLHPSPPQIIWFYPRQLIARKYWYSNIPPDPICAGITVGMEGTPHRVLHIYVFSSYSYCLCLSRPLNRHSLCSPRGFLIDACAKIKCKAGCERKRPAVKMNLTAYGGEQVWKFMQYIFLEIVKIQNEVVFQIF